MNQTNNIFEPVIPDYQSKTPIKFVAKHSELL